MKSKELKRYNINPENKCNSSLDAKPYFVLIAFVCIGFVIDVLGSTLFGLGLAFFGLSVLLLLPSRKLIDFHDEYMILYNKANRLECCVVYYEEVKSWEYKMSIYSDVLTITLEDDSVQRVDGYSKTLFETNLNRYLKDKKVKTKREDKKKIKEHENQ